MQKYSHYKNENNYCVKLFLFFSISELKNNNNSILKEFKNNEFLNKKNFFRICDIEKIKISLHRKCSPLYSVKIWLISFDYGSSSSYPRKTVL